MGAEQSKPNPHGYLQAVSEYERSQSLSEHTFTDTSTNFVAAHGHAKANIINNGNAAVAMARGPNGQAGAWTNGHEACVRKKGKGKAGVNGGMAWAMVGEENMAIAYADAAQARAQGLPAPKQNARISDGRSDMTGCGCDRSKCNKKKACVCPCHEIFGV